MDLILIIALIVLVICFFLLSYVVSQLTQSIFNKRYVPFVATKKQVIDRMIEAVSITEDKKVIDLGSGLGDIVFRVASKTGAKVVGAEIDWYLATASQLLSHFVRAKQKPVILHKDMINVNIDEYDIVMLFLTSTFMQTYLVAKLENELKPGAIVVSYVFDFESQAFSKKVVDFGEGPWGKIFVYTKKK